MSVSAKDLLAKQTEKLGAHRSPGAAPLVPEAAKQAPVEAAPKSPEQPEIKSQQKTVAFPKSKRPETKPLSESIEKEGPTQKKGITLRPSNLQKLDDLELSLRKQGIKANHSGLIQIAIERLTDSADLAEEYKHLQKLDLRFK